MSHTGFFVAKTCSELVNFLRFVVFIWIVLAGVDVNKFEVTILTIETTSEKRLTLETTVRKISQRQDSYYSIFNSFL